MDDASRPSVAFRVLGPVEALRDGRPLPLGGPRQRALLSLLLLEAGRAVNADVLVEELWAGEPTDGAEVTLRSYSARWRSWNQAAAKCRRGSAGDAVAQLLNYGTLARS